MPEPPGKQEQKLLRMMIKPFFDDENASVSNPVRARVEGPSGAPIGRTVLSIGALGNENSFDHQEIVITNLEEWTAWLQSFATYLGNPAALDLR
jgi:hypothetical protein